MTGDAQAALTLGPVLFNWPAERWRDFYFAVADEASIDSVCVGEVVCAKRAPFSAAVLPEVVERLVRGGKEVVLGSPILVADRREAGKISRAVQHARFLPLHVELENGGPQEAELRSERLEPPHGHALRPSAELERHRAARASERVRALVVAQRLGDDHRVAHRVPREVALEERAVHARRLDRDDHALGCYEPRGRERDEPFVRADVPEDVTWAGDAREGFEAVAVTGEGVFDTLRAISKSVVKTLG